MLTPEFWRTDNGLSRLLEPVGQLYGAVTAWRIAHTEPEPLTVPLICVGNLVAGGAGKTPVALALCQRVRALGLAIRPHFLLRGYGGTDPGPTLVDLVRHGFRQVGDEALLLAQAGATLVARDRRAGAKAAITAGADLILMDDGHQNPSLAKDLSIVVIEGAFGFGNQRLLPAGPLRESPERGLARAGAVVILGVDRTGVAEMIPEGLPRLGARLVPDEAALALAGRKVVAFAGIGRPEKFFDTVRAVGGNLLARHPFADHYPYAEADIQPILDEAFALGAVPVTTAKDAVRLSPDQRQQVSVLGVSVVWEDEAAIDSLLRRVCQHG
ncbi:MAG: tetraacyldisaccharide 4'-kinase [Alphaproteobacteria bacterium]